MENKIEVFELSKIYKIYKIKYNSQYSKDIFIKRIDENKNVIYKKVFKNLKNFEDKFLIECPEFKSVNNYIINTLEKIENKKFKKIAKHSWIYKQTKDFNMVMHNHTYLLYTTEKTKLPTEWTSVFYIQLPKNVKNGEGDIVFMTEDKKLHQFSVEENDIIIFPGRLHHMVIETPDAEIERVVFATNFNLNLNV